MAKLDEIEWFSHLCSWILVKINLEENFCMQSRFSYSGHPTMTSRIRSEKCRKHAQGLKNVMKIRWELFFIDYNFEEYWRTNGLPKDGKLTREGQDFI